MVIAREFLDAKRPALPAAAEYLLSRYQRGTTADLRRVIVVVPGSRAGRRLLEILVKESEARALLLTPPIIETVGKLPERLYRPKRPFASDLTQRLVWAEMLRSAPLDLLTPVLPSIPAREEFSRWMDVGDLLRHQHMELAGDGLDFADVARLGRDIDDFTEEGRWQALSQLQQAYLRRLDELQLWDRQTARLVAIDKQECEIDCDLVLVSAVDMNVTMRRMLRQVADCVTALVFASDEHCDRFDDYGCLIPSRWIDVPLPIASEQVMVVDGPAEQAAAVVTRLASFEGKYRADEIVVGVPDEQLIPDIQRALAAAGVNARWGPGQPLGQSQPARLLRAVASYLESGRFADFALLARHCGLGDWLTRRGLGPELLEQLDEYQSEHLPYRLDGEWLEPASRQTVLRSAWRHIAELTNPLRQSARKLTQWAEPILQLLIEIYGEQVFDRADPADRQILIACEAIKDALAGHAQIPAIIMPVVSAGDALRWLMDDIGVTTAPAMPANDAVEMLGWLELPLDDAPALVVTSLNEGFVPESVNSDLFLPNTLRQRLGMLDNDRRYARDAFAVTLLAASRESLQWIVARRNHDGDPLRPSRLLFAVDAESSARRALQFFKPPPEPRRRRLDRAAIMESSLSVPRPQPLPLPIAQIRVTSFRDYLACPYRFYLKHVLQLEEMDDSAREMDGRAFGNLAHDVLSHFGTSARRDTTDPEEIRVLLDRELDQCVARKFGAHPLPAVLVQIEQLRLRLRAFATVQADRAKQGWRIEITEGPESTLQSCDFLVDGEPITLVGRVDRMDYHPGTGVRIVWDYKTSDAGDAPEKTHRRAGEWIDLQLPLYRHLVQSLDIQGPVKLGYIVLPKDTSRTQFLVGQWGDQDLSDADEMTRNVVRGIRRQEFWPPARIPPTFSEAFSAICQDGILQE